MRIHPPLWGNFVGYADQDLLAFAVLIDNRLFVPAIYHAVQAVEKYFKALALSIIDPDGKTETSKTTSSWIITHDLMKLATRCGKKYPYYVQPHTLKNLERFNELHLAARYPWSKPKHGGGFRSSDVPKIEELIFYLRNDIPIKLDDYFLSIALRRCHHKKPGVILKDWHTENLQSAARALKKIFKKADNLIRH